MIETPHPNFSLGTKVGIYLMALYSNGIPQDRGGHDNRDNFRCFGEEPTGS